MGDDGDHRSGVAFCQRCKTGPGLGFLFIPLPRRSSSYGYAQAQDLTWEKYRAETGNSGHDRDDFSDAINFVGWYTNKTQHSLGISKWDAYNQYLVYHEGSDAYKNGSWKNKTGLKQVAGKVRHKSDAYDAHLKQCKAELDNKADSWF